MHHHSSRVLKWFCPPHLYEEIEGDLIQKFNRDVKTFGEGKAKRRLMWNVIRFFRLGILLRNRFSFGLNKCYMLQSHFKIAFRHLARSKSFTVINLLGLSVGIAAFFIIVQYVNFEMSFDDFHSNENQIYRVGLDRYENGSFKEKSSRNFSGIRALLKENFPEVINYTGFIRIPANTGFLFRHNGKIYNEGGGVLCSDSSFFKVFPSFLAKGNPSTVLKGKNDLLISEMMAKILFGSEDPIGKHIERIDDYDTGEDYVITGVLKDIPENSHIHANFLNHIDDSWADVTNWKQSVVSTYVTLLEGTNPKQIENRINTILRKLETENPALIGANVFLQPITDIHLHSNLKDELEANGSKLLVYSLGLIGLVILLIAWVNYINLETARFTLRIKEVGIRRIVGSAKHQLLVQFVVEYFCLGIAAICIAGLALYLLTPDLKTIIGIPMGSFSNWNTPVVIGATCLFVVGSVLVGIYPGVFLLKFDPMATLKGRIAGQPKGSSFRKQLVVFQFVISMVLIALVLIINEQLDFMRFSNRKIEVEHVLVLRNPTAYSGEELKLKHSNYQVFKNKALRNNAIKEVTSSSAVPGAEIGFSYVNLIKKDTNDLYDPTIYKTLFVDDDFISAYSLKLIAGRNLAQPKINDEWVEPWTDPNWTTIILNESAIRSLGFGSPSEAIDQTVYYSAFNVFMKYKILGVIEDYHHESVKKQVFPTIFVSNYQTFQQVYFSIRLNAGSNASYALDHIKKTWTETFPDKPFEYFFLDEYYDRQFKSEFTASHIFVSFAGIAILIAGLGIFGLTLFEANSRLKEISIRKVLGATVANLVTLLSKEYFKLALMAALISVPVIYFSASEWLKNYPVRIGLNGWFFFWPLCALAFVVVVASGFQTYRAANSNPVDHLKNE
jgi:putative ABC transport system permease protein